MTEPMASTLRPQILCPLTGQDAAFWVTQPLSAATGETTAGVEYFGPWGF